MPKQTAKLEYWELVEGGKLSGQVYDHPGFRDGDIVTTTVIVSPPDSIKEGGEVHSKNTIYTLGKKLSNKEGS